MPKTPAVLVTGATGCIGGRLVPVLEASAVRLRCPARHPATLESRVAATTEVVSGDVFDPGSVDRAFADDSHAGVLARGFRAPHDSPPGTPTIDWHQVSSPARVRFEIQA